MCSSRYWLDPLTLAAKRAVDAGIVVVASAGNLGQNRRDRRRRRHHCARQRSLGSDGWRVEPQRRAASAANDTIAKFSSRGPTWIDFPAKPDLVAPGVGIESLADSHSTLYATLPSMLVSGSPQARPRVQALPEPERHEHGGAGGGGHCGADARGKPEAHAERGQGDSAVHRASCAAAPACWRRARAC